MYREPDEFKRLEALLGESSKRIEQLERDVKFRRSAFTAQVRSMIAGCAMPAIALVSIGVFVATIWFAVDHNDADHRTRCRQICHYHDLQVEWIDGTGCDPSPLHCVCGRRGQPMRVFDTNGRDLGGADALQEEP